MRMIYNQKPMSRTTKLKLQVQAKNQENVGFVFCFELNGAA